MHQFHKFILSWNSTCFRQFVCPSSGLYSLYTQQWYMSYRFVDSFQAGPGWNCISILVLLESCLQTCMTYTIAECTVNKILMMDRGTVRHMQSSMTKQICEIGASGCFYYKEKSPVTPTDILLQPHFLRHPCTSLYKNESDWKFANMACLWHSHTVYSHLHLTSCTPSVMPHATKLHWTMLPSDTVNVWDHCTYSVNLRYCAHVLLSCDILCVCSVNFWHTFNLRHTVYVGCYFMRHCTHSVNLW
jgi:hypothetical protein